MVTTTPPPPPPKPPPPPPPKPPAPSLPPSVVAAMQQQKQKDIDTGRATSVTISGSNVVSASGSKGYVAPSEALKTAEQRIVSVMKGDVSEIGVKPVSAANLFSQAAQAKFNIQPIGMTGIDVGGYKAISTPYGKLEGTGTLRPEFAGQVVAQQEYYAKRPEEFAAVRTKQALEKVGEIFKEKPFGSAQKYTMSEIKEMQQSKEPIPDWRDVYFTQPLLQKQSEFQEAGQYLRVQKQTYPNAKEDRTSQALSTLGYMGTGTLLSLGYPILYPEKIIPSLTEPYKYQEKKGISQFFGGLYQMGRETQEQYREAPLGFVSSIIGSFGAWELGTRGIKTIFNIPKVIQSKIETAKLEAKFKNAIVVNPKTETGLVPVNKELSLEVKGYPIRAGTAERVIIPSEKGTLIKTKLTIPESKPEVIDMTKPSSDYFKITGQKGTAIGKPYTPPENPLNLPAKNKILFQQIEKVEPINIITTKESLYNFFGGKSATFKSEGGYVSQILGKSKEGGLTLEGTAIGKGSTMKGIAAQKAIFKIESFEAPKIKAKVNKPLLEQQNYYLPEGKYLLGYEGAVKPTNVYFITDIKVNAPKVTPSYISSLVMGTPTGYSRIKTKENLKFNYIPQVKEEARLGLRSFLDLSYKERKDLRQNIKPAEPVGIFAKDYFSIPYSSKWKPLSERPLSEKEVRKEFKKEIIGKNSINPFDIKPKGVFSMNFEKFGSVPYSEQWREYKDLLITPEEMRKRQRKDIIGKRSIKPLDISPKGIFSIEKSTEPFSTNWREAVDLFKTKKQLRKEIRKKIILTENLDLSPVGVFNKETLKVPLQKESYYKQKRLEQNMQFVEEGLLTRLEARKDVRKAILKRLKISGEFIEKPEPKPLFTISKKIKPFTKPEEVIKKKETSFEETTTKGGSVLILEKPKTEKELKGKIKVDKKFQAIKELYPPKYKYEYFEEYLPTAYTTEKAINFFGGRKEVGRIRVEPIYKQKVYSPFGINIEQKNIPQLQIIPESKIKIIGFVNVKPISEVKSISLVKPITETISKPILIVKTEAISKSVSKSEVVSIPLVDTTSITKSEAVTESITKQKQVPDLVTKQRLKTEERFFKPKPPEPEIKIPKKEKEFKKKKILSLFKKQKGYAVFLKRKGKFKQITPSTSKESALDIGVGKAKSTLAATFKIMPVKEEPIKISTRGEFQRFGKEFRTYQERKGTRIPLKDTFIQISKFRLGTKQERTEIKIAKRNKGGFLK